LAGEAHAVVLRERCAVGRRPAGAAVRVDELDHHGANERRLRGSNVLVQALAFVLRLRLAVGAGTKGEHGGTIDRRRLALELEADAVCAPTRLARARAARRDARYRDQGVGIVDAQPVVVVVHRVPELGLVGLTAVPPLPLQGVLGVVVGVLDLDARLAADERSLAGAPGRRRADFKLALGVAAVAIHEAAVVALLAAAGLEDAVAARHRVAAADACRADVVDRARSAVVARHAVQPGLSAADTAVAL